MNTRFKVLSIFVIYIVSVLVLYILFSGTGYYANKEMKRKLVRLEEAIEEKEGDVKSLRSRLENKKGVDEVRDKELVYSFGDDIYDPLSYRKEAETTAEYKALPLWGCLIIASLITTLYALIITVIIPFLIHKGGRNGRDN